GVQGDERRSPFTAIRPQDGETGQPTTGRRDGAAKTGGQTDENRTRGHRPHRDRVLRACRNERRGGTTERLLSGTATVRGGRSIHDQVSRADERRLAGL